MVASGADPKPKGGTRPRSLRLASKPAQLYFWGLYALTAIVAAGSVVVAPLSLKAGVECILLIALYAVFEEVSRREAALRLRLQNGPSPDMTSVWTLAATVVLPLAYTEVLVAALFAHRWLRRDNVLEGRYLAWLAVCAVSLPCAAGHILLVSIHDDLVRLPSGLFRALVIGLAILVYTVINRMVVYIAIAMLHALNGQGVLGSWDDNLLELSTLCLGGLASVAVLYEPWLTPLVLIPMILLQRGALIRELETVASTDSKTGLLNAIAWEQLATREVSRASRDALPMAIIIIDLDRFKVVNDVHGHLVGDVVLREVGRCLTAELRDYDVVGRFGGEEFVAMLPDVSVLEAGVIAERVRARINTLQMSVLSPATSSDANDSLLSASLGVACFPGDGLELQELLHAADAALYVAKNAGRNRVEFAKLQG